MSPFWSVPRIWPDSTVVIIGGGPSLRKQAGLPISEEGDEVVFPAMAKFLGPVLKRFRTIGVNNAFEISPLVDACWFGDCAWFTKYQDKLAEYAGLKAHCCPANAKRPGTKRITRGKPKGIEERPNYISWNGCSGNSAINLAYHLGARRVVLLGFDMKRASDGDANWHKRHNKGRSDKEIKRRKKSNQFDRFLKMHPYIRRDAERLGLEILNATPESAITEFKSITMEELYALEGSKNLER